jgi:hypothetical protein
MSRLARLAMAALLALALGAQMPAPAPLDVTSRRFALNPADPAQDRVGRLRYLGGVELRSRDARVGGISGMRFLGDGSLMAVTDAGDLLTLSLEEAGERLTGVRSLAIARIPGPDGQPLRGKAEADAESLELDADGTPFIAFERRHRIMRFPAGDRRPRPLRFADEPWLQSLPGNGGIEAMARIGPSWLFLAEDPPAGAHAGVLVARSGADGAYGRVRLDPPAGFKPTDAAAVDDRTVAILLRRFSPATGVAGAVGLARVDHERLVLGPLELVATFAPPLSVDNLEALAIRREGERTFLYIASDDNFSPLQRSLLMKFELLAR